MIATSLLEDNLRFIERVVVKACRQRGVFDPEAEDIRQQVLLKLTTGDSAELAAFRGDSSLETFVTVVTTRMCIDEIRLRKGRWRPSVISQRLGYSAVVLEQLVYRDGLGYEESVAKLLAEGTVRSRQELDEIWSRIPPHPVRRFVPSEEVPEPATTDDPERQAQARERTELEARRRAALDEELSALPAEDQLIVRRLFYDGRTVAEVARELGIDQRPLYRRRDKLLERLRCELERRGFNWPD